MKHQTKYWIFSNNKTGFYKDSDWDTSTILKTNRYYLKDSEPNRAYVKKGDSIILRTYEIGYWGSCEIDSNWISDPKGYEKHKKETGWFLIKNVNKWKVILPFEIISKELSNHNHRLRIAKATKEDKNKIELAFSIYQNLGYGITDGEFFIWENGLEEAVKKNLSQLKLTLAEDNIQQQCSLGIGVGRTDLICRDDKGNFVVLEIKATHSSDNVVGQILRYMGYVRENWAEKENKIVKGIILTPSYDEKLRLATKEAGIKILRIRIL